MEVVASHGREMFCSVEDETYWGASAVAQIRARGSRRGSLWPVKHEGPGRVNFWFKNWGKIPIRRRRLKKHGICLISALFQEPFQQQPSLGSVHALLCLLEDRAPSAVTSATLPAKDPESFPNPDLVLLLLGGPLFLLSQQVLETHSFRPNAHSSSWASLGQHTATCQGCGPRVPLVFLPEPTHSPFCSPSSGLLAIWPTLLFGQQMCHDGMQLSVASTSKGCAFIYQ